MIYITPLKIVLSLIVSGDPEVMEARNLALLEREFEAVRPEGPARVGESA